MQTDHFDYYGWHSSLYSFPANQPIISPMGHMPSTPLSISHDYPSELNTNRRYSAVSFTPTGQHGSYHPLNGNAHYSTHDRPVRRERAYTSSKC